MYLDFHEIAHLCSTAPLLRVYLIHVFFDDDMKKIDGIPAIHWAAREGHLLLVRFLINYAKPKNWLEVQAGARKLTPLLYAIRSNMLHIVATLIEKGAEYDKIRSPSKNRKHPLFVAVMAVRINCVSILLQMGANPNFEVDSAGTMLIHCAVLTNNKEIVELLVQAGAFSDVFNVPRFEAPLHYSIMYASPDMTDAVIMSGADPNPICPGRCFEVTYTGLVHEFPLYDRTMKEVAWEKPIEYMKYRIRSWWWVKSLFRRKTLWALAKAVPRVMRRYPPW